MTMKIWFDFFLKLGNFGLSSALDNREETARVVTFFHTQVDEAPFNKCRNVIKIWLFYFQIAHVKI